MPVTISELTTEVIAERDAHLPPAAGPGDAQATAPTRSQIAAIVRDETRTRAEGFDD